MKLGDKVMYTIKEEDKIETTLPRHRFVPEAAQHCPSEKLNQVTHRTDDLLRNRFDENAKPKRKVSIQAFIPLFISDAILQ